ncbi:hypothetical protein GCM10027064_07760 [Microbacterium petrolearium]|jgi:monoamine oxidase
MRVTRRTLLLGAGTGAVTLLLASCTPDPPAPRPSPSSPSPTLTPEGGVPAPADFARSAWTTDPFARGARAYVPPGSSEADRAQLARPLAQRVFFAGDALGDPVGSLTAAAQDGVRAAVAVTEVAGDGERVFVVGAGVAGARAARFLADAGYEVTVVEARDRVGGRLHTLDDKDWPVVPQLGAWLVDADDDSLRARLEELDADVRDLEGEAARSAEGEGDVPSLDPIRSAAAWAQDQPADVPLSEALAQSGADPEDPAVAAALAVLAGHAGADADELSAWYPPALPGPRAAALGDTARLAADAVDGLSVSLSTSVLGVSYDETGVSLRLGTGEAVSADRAILTVPIGVLQRGSIEFDPPLPLGHRSAIAALGSGAVEQLWLRFEEPFWATDAAVWHLLDGEATLRTWVNLAAVTGDPILVGLIGGEAARAFAELDEADAVQAALDALAPFVDA